jgi:hypothetical protein
VLAQSPVRGSAAASGGDQNQLDAPLARVDFCSLSLFPRCEHHASAMIVDYGFLLAWFTGLHGDASRRQCKQCRIFVDDIFLLHDAECCEAPAFAG